ncbi:MAG: HAMP domain-containing histidine kinase, partial [Acidobacteriota bacterium]|nr:HAMP domain-containing histidine kinase [Acidobacteriota bacterium]
VLSPTGKLLGESAGTPVAVLAQMGSMRKPGYFDFQIIDQHFRALRLDGIRVIDREEAKGGVRRTFTVLYAAPIWDSWHEALESVEFYVAASAGLMVVTCIALVWFLRRKLYPLQELAQIAGRVSARSWEFVPPKSVLHTSELAPIAHSIEGLLRGLRQAFERQRQLTGDAAHELKTSIAVLKSSLQLLTLSRRTALQYEAGLEGLLVDTERMEDLATRMLALARLEESPSETNETTDLQAVAHNVADRLRPLAELKKVALQVTAGEPASVLMQTDDAEVLCSNLILNALQHSSAGSVSASVQTQDGIIELRVMDQGEGIPDNALPHVFDRFYRADRSRSRISGGAGLGLSICKAIVERSNGTIEIQSTLGTGTQVFAKLPVAPAVISQASEGTHFVGKA